MSQGTVVPSSVFESKQRTRLDFPASNPAVRYDHPRVVVGIEVGKILQALAVYQSVLAGGLDAEDVAAVELDIQVLRTLQTQGRRFELRLLKEAEWVLPADELVLGRPVFLAELEQRFGEIVRY